MNKLCVTLPPFSPDYSGVCSALFELNCLCVIHDASGCTGNYVGYDEPRWYGSRAKVFCSGLREMDAVLGLDEKLIAKVVAAGRDLSPDFVAILGSPVPMVIGTDMGGIAHEIQTELGIPAFGFNCTGLRFYSRGVAEALCSLIDRFTPAEQKHETGDTLNVIGLTPLDFSSNANAEDICAFLARNGFQVTARFSMGITMEQVRKAATADVNLVVSESGLKPAQLLREKFGIPYVVGTPVANDVDLVDELRAAAIDGVNRTIRDESGEGGVLVVADQILENSLRRSILKKNPDASVCVGTMFGLNEEISAGQDLDIENERSLLRILRGHRFSKLVADPMICELVEPDDGIETHPLPHVAISSKAHWDRYPLFTGDEMERFVDDLAK